MEQNSMLCETCQHINLDNYLNQATSPGTVELGYFQDIAKKDDCPLCRLVIQTLNCHSRKHWKTGIYPVEVCYLGRYDETSTSPVLEVWFNSTSETLPDGMRGHSTTLGQILPLLPRFSSSHDANRSGSTSRVQLVGEKVDVSRIQRWMSSCASHHGLKCNPTKPQTREKADVGLLLVDVKRMRLTTCDWNSTYIALSYVWGSSKGLTTTKANIDHLQREGALQELRGELPQAIRDAIDLVDAVGEAYLWVDALCIIQDDDASKAAYVSRMNEIYSNARVTLVTLNNPSYKSMLPGVAHPRALAQSPVEINGLHLVPRLPQLFEVEQSATWSRRAWTFQEGILSRRCLFFSQNQVFWQCRSSYQSEDCPDDYDHDASKRLQGRKANALERDTRNDPRMQFSAYESLVKQYSPRSLTYPADSLFAFTGILGALAESFGWKLASALPESALDLALLWRPMFSVTMWPRPLSGQTTGPTVCTSPTWCWTAWHGDIFWDPWRLDSFAAQEVSIKTEVACFWIQDRGGLRQIQRGQALDSGTQTVSHMVTEHAQVNSKLLFEAKAIDIMEYNLGPPNMDQCAWWNGDVAGGGLSSYFRNNMSSSLWVYDASGHHCGTLPGFGVDAWSAEGKNRLRHDLVLVSHCSQDEVTQSAMQDFQNNLPLEYPSDKEYYEEIFDARYYKYKSDWALNVILVRWKGTLAERVAVGQIHADAWDGTVQEVKLITLV
ncbi:heterokaryon incompatibility protein-domain-containing protein [Mariannaea sp. PMI_226]|nr:heterokaryon incompatibility protein-domain-containing protein [Mariannaea sp. PMI_226]